MLQFSIRAVGVIGTLLGVFSIFLTVENLSTPTTVGLVVVLTFSFVVLGVDLYNLIRNSPHKFEPNSPQIIDYMLKWLSTGGRTAIFTRDMSWAVAGSDVTKLLEAKAARHELLIFVAQMSPVVEALHSLGAEVYIYPKQFTPRSRFTIIDFEKHGARIAIGVVEGKKHVIRESSVAESPMSPVLEDLVSLAKAAGKKA